MYTADTLVWTKNNNWTVQVNIFADGVAYDMAIVPKADFTKANTT